MALEDALDRKEIVSLDFSTERVTSLLMFSVDGFPVRIEHNRRGAR
jgi:hypothetical protein